MSDCGCVYAEVGEQCEFSKRKKVVARKIHRCVECRRAIEPGEEYERIEGVWEGEFMTVKTCSDCMSMRDSFFCGSWCFESIWEDLAVHIGEIIWGGGEIASSCIVPLTKPARDRVCDMIEAQWEKNDAK